MNATKRAVYRVVYVVGFAPNGENSRSSAGFEWRKSHVAAVAAMIEASEDSGLDVRLTRIEIPANVPDRDVTCYLDNDPESWEPPCRERG